MKQRTTLRRARTAALLVLAAGTVLGTAACDDDPFAFPWSDEPNRVLLYSLSRPELNLVSAFNFFEGLTVLVEAPQAAGSWDMAVDTRDGRIVILPPGELNVVGAARITTLPDMTLDEVREAPSDTLVYIADRPIPVEMGDVYIVKTNRAPGRFGRSCVYYAKLTPVDIDPERGTLTFDEVTNPVCNSRDLVPPD